MSTQYRKNQLESTQQTIKFFDTFLRASTHGIVITDATQNIVVVNEAFCALFDQHRQDMTGTKLSFWLEQLNADSQNRWSELEKRVRFEGACSDVEFRVTTKDEVRYLSVNASLLERVADEETGIIISIWRDITEQKRMETALRRGEERYEMATRAARVGVWDWNVETGDFYLDPNVKAILGYSDEDIPNDLEVWASYVHPDDEQPVMEAFQAHIEGRTPEYVFEHRMLHKDGCIRWILVRGKAIRDEQGNAIRVVGTDTDITEHKQAEEALQQAHRELIDKAAQLEEANAELDQYARVVSHDLKAPLRAIHNYADFLRADLEGTLDGEQKEYLDALGRAVREGEELVDDLLKLSRIGRRSKGTHNQYAPIGPIDIGVFLRELVASLNLFQDVEIVMTDDWPTIEADPTLLRQIFQNLIINAIKFNRSPRKRVEIGWCPVGEGHYELFVRDNGIGIEYRHIEQIFHVFQQLHTTDKYDGTGIGLAIVKKAVSKLNGSVRVESKPGEGSTFFVALPKTPKES